MRFAHFLAQAARNVVAMFDGEVGDATTRIEPVGRVECIGRADIETGPAASAVIAFGFVGLEIERRKYRTEEKPGAEFA